MVSQLEYKNRIASTKSLQKIFNAQELIAASRIAKTRDRFQAAQPYADAVTDAVRVLATQAKLNNAMLVDRSKTPEAVHRVAVLSIAADRGMAGPYSAAIIRETEKLIKRLQGEGKEVILYTSGRRVKSFYNFRDRPIAQSWEGDSDNPSLEVANDIAKVLVERYNTLDKTRRVDALYIVCTRFKNMVSQTPRIVKMLPLSVAKADEVAGANISAPNTAEADGKILPIFSFEPSAEDVVEKLLPRYIQSRILECLYESAASETASRQRAMHTATENSAELIEDLVLQSNKARQAAITNELTEIVGSANALAEED